MTLVRCSWPFLEPLKTVPSILLCWSVCINNKPKSTTCMLLIFQTKSSNAQGQTVYHFPCYKQAVLKNLVAFQCLHDLMNDESFEAHNP